MSEHNKQGLGFPDNLMAIFGFKRVATQKGNVIEPEAFKSDGSCYYDDVDRFEQEIGL